MNSRRLMRANLRLGDARIQSSEIELRALRRLQREQQPKSPFVFTSERGSPFTTARFACMIERAGKAAKLAFEAHPHMLRHASGYALAKRGHVPRHKISSTPYVIPSCRRRDLRIFGESERHATRTHRITFLEKISLRKPA
jgi:integrase